MLLNLTENENFLSTRSVRCYRVCRKCVCGRGFALDPTGGAHDAPQTPSRLGRGHPFQAPSHSATSAPRPSRLRRSGLPLLHIISGYATAAESDSTEEISLWTMTASGSFICSSGTRGKSPVESRGVTPVRGLTELRQFADIVCRFWLQKRSKSQNLAQLTPILGQSVSQWGLRDILWRRLSPKPTSSAAIAYRRQSVPHRGIAYQRVKMHARQTSLYFSNCPSCQVFY